MENYIHITRHPDGEPHYVDLVVLASNGLSSGGLEFYLNTDDLIKIGEALANFPEHDKANFLFERGSERPEDNHANYFRLRACCIRGGKSHAIQLRMNNNTNIRGA